MTQLADKPADKPATISCAGGCKREWPAAHIAKSGWDLLPISGRYRCIQCWKELQQVNGVRTP